MGTIPSANVPGIDTNRNGDQYLHEDENPLDEDRLRV